MQFQIDPQKTQNDSENYNSEMLWAFQVLRCSVQSEVNKIILVKSSLREMKFNQRMFVLDSTHARWYLRVT